MSESTVALVAVAITATANVVLQILGRIEAARVAQQAKDDAAALKQAAIDAAAEAVKVKQVLAEVKTTTDVKIDGLVTTAERTHALVNSNMAAQLKISAVALRRIAEMSPNPSDIVAADLAEKALLEHEAKQAVIDAKENKP